MMRSLYTAASGMYAEQTYLDTIAHNLANVNTTSYKKTQIEFQDLIYQTIQAANSHRNLGVVVPTEMRMGHGVKPVAIEKVHSQGTPTQTSNPLDIAIEGEGFFRIVRGDNTFAYTRDGNFKRSSDGEIVTSDGFHLDPPIVVPDDTLDLNITADGAVLARLADEVDYEEIGQIDLVRFTNPAGLKPIGRNLYLETSSSGPPIEGQPTVEEFGSLAQGYLEASNVQVVEEMVQMISAQRAYEVNSKAIKTADTMLQTANNLKH